MSEGPAYCPYYCEENIWQLCADPRVAADERRVLFICNRGHQVAMWGQKIAPTSRSAGGAALPIVWDYHVILLARATAVSREWQAWDLDARGPCPQPASTWLERSFEGTDLLPPEFEPQFRLLDAAAYRRHFHSDRRHMRRPDGSFMQPPPSWPQIQSPEHPGGGSNLARFLDMDDREIIGELFDLPGLRRWLAQSEAATRA